MTGSALTRRKFLSSVAFAAVISATTANGRTFKGALPWTSMSASPPTPVVFDGWHFFTSREARLVEAIVDRLVPGDELSVGGKDAGCAVYIDRQLAGSYGSSTRLYTQGPFLKGLPTQGYQGAATPNIQYRSALAAIDKYVSGAFAAKSFADLPPKDQDQLLKAMESGSVELPDGVDGKQFFNVVLNSTMEGFFADPIYGGNKDMVSWKMLGFPGARYDYRDFVSRHNETYPLPPVSILGATDWASK